MITCPDCHAENEHDARECQSCGRALTQAEESAAPLPQWLQQLKPEAEEEAPLEAKTPVGVASASMLGSDSLIAAAPSGRGKSSKKDAPAKRASAEAKEEKNGAGATMTETASLISEDDLPAWLRAFGEAETKQQAATSTDESWMVGAEAEGAQHASATQNLAQSWQSPAQPAAARARTGATSIFARPAEGAAKPERVIAPSVAPTPPAPEPEPAARPANSRLDLPRPTPMPRQSGGMSLQRVALIAFVAALIIFLIVVGIFLVGPSFG